MSLSAYQQTQRLSESQVASMLIGSFFWGSVGDVKGRVKTMILCQACNALFIVASSLSQDLWFLIFMRLFSGFGVGGTSPLIFVYVVELLPLKNRGKMTGLLSCSFMVGQVLVAGLAWGIIPQTTWSWTVHGFTFNSWRIFMLASALPAISSFLLFMWFPESPRFLMRMNRMSEAKAVIQQVYKTNGYKEPYDNNYTIARYDGPLNRKGIWNGVSKMASNSVDLIKRNDVRSRFLYSSTVLFCLSFSYYGLTMWFPTLLDRMESSNSTSVCDHTLDPANHTRCDFSDQNEVYFDTFLQAASSLPGNIFYLVLVDTLGRKLLSGVTMIMTAVSVFFIWFVNSQLASVVMTCVFAAITVVSWNAMALLTTEIFPTELRSTARGVQAGLFNRVAAIIASVIFGALIATHCAVPILLIACLLAFGGILTYKLPNTTQAAIS